MKRNSKFIFGLGLILDTNYEAIHHRTMLKILLNPIFKFFGKVIVSNIKTVKTMSDFSFGSYMENENKRKFLFIYEIKDFNKKDKINFVPFIDSELISKDAVYIIPNKDITNKNEYEMKFAVRLFN